MSTKPPEDSTGFKAGNPPSLSDGHTKHADWLTKAANRAGDPFVEAERHGRGLDAVLVLRTRSGLEATFHRLRDAFKPDTLVATLAELDGTEPPSYSQSQARRVASAMVRFATLTSEIGDTQTFTDYGRQYLEGCLAANRDVTRCRMADPRDEYRAALTYQADTKSLNGGRDEPPPPILYAPDLRLLHIPRVLFWEWVRIRHGKIAPTSLIGHMTLAGWMAYDLDQRPTGQTDRQTERARLRLWRIPAGWEGVAPERELRAVAERPR